MDNRDILAAPEQAIISHFGAVEACQNTQEIMECCAAIQSQKKEIKKTKFEKQECAAQFKKIDKKTDHAAFDTCKQQMQGISKKLKQAEQERCDLEAKLAQFFDTKKTIKPDFPERFSPLIAQTNTSTDDASDVVICLADNKDESRWTNYVNSHPRGNSSHLFGWKNVFTSAFGHQCFMFIAKKNETVVGVFPVCYLTSKLFGSSCISLPFLNYGGALADSKTIEYKLMEAGWAEAKKKGASYLEVRTCDPTFDLPSIRKKVSMILTMPESQAQLESNFGSKIRAQTKQTEEHKPSFHVGGAELLNDFYTVFAENMRDLGTPVYSKTFFKTILTIFPENAFVAVVKIKNRPMGCAFLFGYKDMLEIPWASTLKKANKYNVNMWMYKNILQECLTRGYDYFDFGRSTKDAGTYRFKKQWGAKPMEHFWYYCLPQGEAFPEINPDNPKFKLAIAIWKKIPVCITKVIGPPVVKNIP